MQYRFQRFSAIDPGFVKQFLSETPDSSRLSYRELLDRCMKTRYGSSDFFAKHMQRLGNEAVEVFASFEVLQKAWARDHGVAFDESRWLIEIVLAQVRQFKPDVIYLQNLYLFDPAMRAAVREAAGQKARLVGWRFAPTDDFSSFRDLDLVLTGSPEFARKLRDGGGSVAECRWGFEPVVLSELGSGIDPDLSFTFAGTLGAAWGPFSGRYAILEQLLRATPLEIWGEPEPVLNDIVRRAAGKAIHLGNEVLRSSRVSRDVVSRLPIVRRGVEWSTDPSLGALRSRYPDRVHNAVYGLGYYRTFARSKITFNMHWNSDGDNIGNIRLFEATGCGACVLTEDAPGLRALFDAGEVVTYTSAADCVEKVRYLLENEDERARIATAGQRRTLKDHTMGSRIDSLHELINDLVRNVNVRCGCGT
jgi:hypothetical protein